MRPECLVTRLRQRARQACIAQDFEPGLDREAYYAAWVVTEYWLEHGMTFASVARIPRPKHRFACAPPLMR